MKKTLLIIAAFLSLAAGAAEEKHSWFDTDIAEIDGVKKFWPEDGSDYVGYKCVVTNTAAGTFADSRVSFDAEAPMTVVPDDPASITDISYAKVSATMKMEPFAETDLPAVPAGAKTAAIAVVSEGATNFWVAAGTDELVWTNTCIAADVTKDVTVVVTVAYGVNCVTTQWSLDGKPFVSKIALVAELHGVDFRGSGQLVECWADAQAYGELVDFYLTGVDKDVIVTVTTTNGSELVMTDLGVYRYASGGTVYLSFTLPEGWKYWDGETEWTDEISPLQEGAYTPLSGRGIFDTDIGPEDCWFAVPWSGAAERFATLDEALAALKNNCALMSGYSAEPREIVVAEDGKSLSVNGEVKPAKPHHHFAEVYGMAATYVDDGEADITSLADDPDDPTIVTVGTIEETWSGFGYSVQFADDPAFTSGLGSTEPVPGVDGEKLELAAPKGEGGSRFYRIQIVE